MSWPRRILWSITVVYWLALFVLTHTPLAKLPGPPTSDKVAHFLAYLVLSFLAGTTLYLAFPQRRRLMPVGVLLLAAAYGAVDELTQPLVGRFCEWGDWFADCAGAATGAAVLYLLERLTRPRVPQPA